MAKYSDSLYGRISGRAVDTVAAQWKGIKYFRTYVKPSDPKSTAQTQVRTRFKDCVEWCKWWNETVYKPFWSPLPKRESSFNAAVSANYKKTGALPTDGSGWIMHTGSMRSLSADISISKTANSAQTVTWATDLKPGEDADDIVVVGAFQRSGDGEITGMSIASAARESGQVSLPAASGGLVTYGYGFTIVVKKDRSAGSHEVTYTL